jgi:hypothetical protein
MWAAEFVPVKQLLLVIACCLAASSAAAQARRPQNIRGAESPLAGAAGRTPSFGEGSVSFRDQRRLVKRANGLQVESNLTYFHWQLGLSGSSSVQLVLCSPSGYAYQNGRWACTAEAGRRGEFVTVGENRESLIDMIKSPGSFRLWWYFPPANGQPERREWSTPFDVSP